MTYYAHIVDVPAPADVYDATHERAERDLVGPMPARQAKVAPLAPPQVVEFTVRRLAIPAAGIAT